LTVFFERFFSMVFAAKSWISVSDPVQA